MVNYIISHVVTAYCAAPAVPERCRRRCLSSSNHSQLDPCLSFLCIKMSFQDIETGLSQRPLSPQLGAPQSQEESAFLALQSSMSMQVFKINANVQGILKLVDQLGTGRDSANLRKSL